jgi:hypothetical protein
MTQRRSWSALLAVLATTTAVALATIAALAQAPTRDIVLQLDLPNKAAPQLRIVDGGTGTVEMSTGGKYGFVPRVRQGTTDVVDVTIYDLGRTPNERLGSVEAITGGDTVYSDTNPAFGVRVLRIVNNQ